MATEDKFDQVKGRAEQAAGDLTDNEELQAQGEQHEKEGKLKGAIHGLADKASDAVDKASNKMDDKR